MSAWDPEEFDNHPEVADKHLLLPAVQRSLRAIPKVNPDTDEGLRKLAEHYAETIDEARTVALNARALIAEADKDDGPELAKRMVNALMKYSDSSTTLAELGPKLQAVMESLGASPKARAAMKPGNGGKTDAPAAGRSPIAERRAREAARVAGAREHGSASVDSAAS